MTIKVITLDGTHEDWFAGETAAIVPYHRMYGKQYCLPSLVCFDREIVAELETAAAALDHIFWKTMRFAQRYLPDSFLCEQLGIHEQLLGVVRMEVPLHGVARQDWIINGRTLKLIEYNTDTPTGVPEVAYLAGKLIARVNATGRRQLTNPSIHMAQYIREAFAKLSSLYLEAGYQGKLWFTCHGEFPEDVANTRFLLERAAEVGIDVAYAPLASLQVVPDEGLFVEGERVEKLYRLYPLEYIPDEADTAGYPIGVALLQLVEQGLLTLINPAQSLLTQTKGMLALIHSLYKRRELMVRLGGLKEPLYTPDECAAIERWMLPAEWSDSLFKEAGVDYVRKSFFGREGKGTTIHKTNGAETVDGGFDSAVETYYRKQPQVVQQYEPMLPLTVQTEQGLYDGYLLPGVFLVGRKVAGILPRIGAKVTGDMAYFCGAAVE